MKVFASFDELLEVARAQKPNDGFAAIAANPPYQVEGTVRDKSDTTASNVFQHFYTISTLIAERATLIFPGGRWMQRSKGCESIADEIFSTVKSIDWYPNGDEKGVDKIFLHVGIPDGVSIVTYDRNFKGDSIFLNGSIAARPSEREIVPLNGDAVEFISKISGKYTAVLKASKSSSDSFGIRSNFVELNPNSVVLIKEDPSNFENPIKAWLGNEVPGKAKRVQEYWIDKSKLDWNDFKEEMLLRWKVVASQGQVSKRPATANYFTVDNEHLVGETWLVLNSFKSEIEANNFCTYLNSKFARKLLNESRGAKIAGWGSFVPDLTDAVNPRTGQIGYFSDWTDDDLKKLFNDCLTETDWKYVDKEPVENDLEVVDDE